MSNTVPTSTRVVQGVAAHDGVDPTDLEPALHEVIDTDALDALFRSPDDASTTVEFAYRGAEVCVDDSGRAEVTRTTGDLDSSTVAE